MKKTFKKALSVILAVTVVLSGVAGLAASAAEVKYYTQDGIRTGVESVIGDDGVHYFDIADGGMLDNDQMVPEFYIHALTKEYNGTSVVKMWANIASQIFEDAGHGTGYSLYRGGNDTMFDDYFTQSDNSLSFSMNLIDLLCKTEATNSGSVDDALLSGGMIQSTGLTYFSSLEAVQKKMTDLIAVDGFSYYSSDELLEEITGSGTGFDISDDGEGKPVIASIATNVFVPGGSGNAFALAFYDFELIPFVSEDLEFITAAEGYDTIADADAANAPGVEYNTSSTGEAFVSYTTNPSRTAANTSVSFSESSSVSVSNSMQSTHSHTYGHSVGVGVSLGVAIPKLFKVGGSVNYGFTSQDTIATAYGETKSLSETTNRTSSAQISLPAHTKIGMSQQKSETEVVLDYDCPVYITYKVAVISLNATGLMTGVEALDAGYVCTVFGSAETLKGTTATENLNKRAIQYLDMTSFEESQYYLSSDKNKSGVGWKSIIDSTQNNGHASIRECVTWLSGNIPLSVAGAEITMKQSGVQTNITDIQPLYNLSNVIVSGSSSYTLAKGGSIDLLTVGTAGYNEYGVAYHGYLPIRGAWSVCDENGNPVTGETGITLERPTYTQILTANEIGDYYVKYSIDEKTYTDVDDSSKYITNADLNVYPIVKISVTNTGDNHTCVAGEWATTIPATCFMEGAQVRNCLTCGIQMETRVLEKAEHIHMVVTTPATCTENGSVISSCGVCGAAISNEEITATGHNEGVWKIDFEATADHNGQMSRYCTKCGEILETKEITLHTHEKGYERIVTPATCTQYGEKGIFCKICGVIYETETIPAKGHGETFAVTTIKATCTENGEKTLFCSDCHEAVGTEEIKANGHSGDTFVVTANPTCTQPGEEVLYCDGCGEIIGKKEIPANGHSAEWLTVEEATCTKYGKEEKICSECGAVLETRRIEKEEHIPGKWEITHPSTCTQSGLMQQACALCGALIGEPVVIEPHEHQTGSWVTVLEPDCENRGEKVQSCTVCKGAVATETIPALGHTEGTWITAIEATCENAGEKHLVCTRCEHTVDKKEVEALSHSFSEWHSNNNGTHSRTCLKCTVVETNNCGYKETVTPSTCTEGGYTTYVCNVCSHTYVSDYTDALGHNWSEWAECSDGCCHERECLREGCNAAETEDHNWGEWVYNEDGEFFKNGTKTRTCGTCGASETDEALHTSFVGKIFYSIAVFFGNITHKIIWIFSLNWLFPELTITPQI